MQGSSGPWVVSWYQESARLGVPGHAIMTGLYAAYPGATVFYFLENLVPNDTIAVTGDAGNLYTYRVESVETYPLDTFPYADVFTRESDAEVLTLFTGAGQFDFVADTYADVLVVRASRQPEPVSPGPERRPAMVDSPAGCPADPYSLPLPVSATFPAHDDPSDLVVTGPASAEIVETLNALLDEATACSLVARSTQVLADGTVRALVCPDGDLPLEALQFVHDENLEPVNERLATLCGFLRFVEEDGEWRAAYLPGGRSGAVDSTPEPDAVRATSHP